MGDKRETLFWEGDKNHVIRINNQDVRVIINDRLITATVEFLFYRY